MPLARCHLDSPLAMNWSITDLGTVGEIAELGFPDAEHAGVIE
jgi:hypothetical protein